MEIRTRAFCAADAYDISKLRGALGKAASIALFMLTHIAP